MFERSGVLSDDRELKSCQEKVVCGTVDTPESSKTSNPSDKHPDDGSLILVESDCRRHNTPTNSPSRGGLVVAGESRSAVHFLSLKRSLEVLQAQTAQLDSPGIHMNFKRMRLERVCPTITPEQIVKVPTERLLIRPILLAFDPVKSMSLPAIAGPVALCPQNKQTQVTESMRIRNYRRS